MIPTAGARSLAGNADASAEAQLVQSIELWMRAYPRRWRAARGQELVDVVVDLAGPDTRRLDTRAAFDLVRGGWATRWREHPSLHTWLLYRMFDRRIPVAHRPWALDDIDGFWYPMRRFLGGVWPVFVIILISGSGSIPAFVMLALMVASSMFVSPESFRRQSGIRHVAPRFGEVPVEGTLVGSDVPQQRVTARSGLTWAALFLGTTGAASVVAALFSPKVLLTTFSANTPEMGPGFGWESVVAPTGGSRVVAVAILLVALGVGVLGAMAVHRRCGRLLGERPDQPHRVLHPVTASGRAGVLFWALLIVALVWLEVSGQIVLGLSVLLGTVALLLLPGALVALLVVRRAQAHDLAGRDVWRIATRGRVPGVDRPARGLRPQPGPLPQGASVRPTGPADQPPA